MSRMSTVPATPHAAMQTVVVWTGTAAALLLCAGVVAYWTLIWFAPAPIARSAAAPISATESGAARRLFGAAAAPTARAPESTPISLVGIVSESARKRGYAVVRIGTEPARTVRGGDTLAPGLKLLEVHANHLVIERDGTREVLTWPAPRSGGPSSGGPSIAAAR